MIPLAHPIPQTKQHLDRFSHFYTDDRRVSLYFAMGRPFPLKIAHYHGGSGPPSNTWFPGSNRVLNPRGISIGSAVFAGLTNVTDRATDHGTRLVQEAQLSLRDRATRDAGVPVEIW